MALGLGVASERALPEHLRGWAEASPHPQLEQEIKRPLKFLAGLPLRMLVFCKLNFIFHVLEEAKNKSE